MRARIYQEIVFIHPEDVPPFKKKGPVVRNSYFWALRSIADRAPFGQEWEFADVVWPALARMLMAFAASGYLGYRETLLEFPLDQTIPPVLKPASSWYDPSDGEEEAGNER